MPVTIEIPNVFRKYAQQEKSISISANTVEEALELLINKFPDLGDKVFTSSNELRQYINIYLNRRDIRALDRLETSLSNGDTIKLIPAIAGG